VKTQEVYWADSSGRRNILIEGCVIGRPSGWTTAVTGRPAMRSPGRPGVNEHREVRRQFWRRIAEGLSSEEAAAACGVSQPVGFRWFRQGGGMSPLLPAPLSGRYLSIAEREEIALLKAQSRGSRPLEWCTTCP
jgi:hypothetical protein